MKKIIFRTFLALVILLLLGALGVHLFLDGAIKHEVETIGPKIAKVDIKLGSVSLSLLSGAGSFKGLVVGNPPGYKSPSAIEVGSASLGVEPRSILSQKIIVTSVNVQEPQITFETDVLSSNLKKILNNLDESSGESGKEPAPSAEKAGKPAKKFEVDDLLIKGGKVHVIANVLGNSQSATVPLPEIHLQNLGKDSDGITAAELSKQILKVVLQKAAEQAAPVVLDMSKGGQYLSRELGTNSAEKITKGLGDLLKKK